LFDVFYHFFSGVFRHPVLNRLKYLPVAQGRLSMAVGIIYRLLPALPDRVTDTWQKPVEHLVFGTVRQGRVKIYIQGGKSGFLIGRGPIKGIDDLSQPVYVLCGCPFSRQQGYIRFYNKPGFQQIKKKAILVSKREAQGITVYTGALADKSTFSMVNFHYIFRYQKFNRFPNSGTAYPKHIGKDTFAKKTIPRLELPFKDELPEFKGHLFG
jgi:hypothetical protein